MSDGLDELYQVSQAVLSVTRQMSVRDVLQVIVRSARSLVGARYAALGVPDEGDSFAEFVVDGISSAEWQAIGPLPRRHGMLAVLLNEGKPERLADIRKDPRFEGWPSAHPQMSHFLGVPVRDGDQVLGIIFAANKTSAAAAGRGFTERDEEILSLFAAHAAIALTNARLYERSQELSVMQERSRLARDLHDAVTQKVFSIRAHARAATVLAARDPMDAARVRTEIEVIGALGAEAHAELRAVIDGLAPPDLEAAGLAESLRRYAVLAGRAHGVPVTFTAGALPALGPRAEAALYRVAQEALHNALRHAGASGVRVALSRAARRVVLEVSDDGHGFVPEAPSSGLGLASMRERASAAGAALTIRSGETGTLVRMTVPVKAGPVKAGAVKAGVVKAGAGQGRGGQGEPGQGGAGHEGARQGGRRAMTRPISVLIVDDHPVVRRGLRVLLEVQDGIEVAGEAGDGTAALALDAEHAPDVILLDLKLPGMDGIAVLSELRSRDSAARVLVLTSATEPASASLAVRSGAAGVLYKDVDPDALVRAIRSVHDGHLLLASEAAGPLVRSAGTWGPGVGLDTLTSREREVLAELTKGRSNREIARALGVSEKTVKAHVSSVLAKLGVQDRTQAALLAVRNQL